MKRKHGHGSVEEHPKGSGRYRVRAWIDGRNRTVSPPNLSQSEAIAHADAYSQIRAESDLREGITLAQFGAGFLDRRERRKVRSIKDDRNRWKTYIEEDRIGKIAISVLRRSDVIEWRDRLLTQKSKRGHQGLGGQTFKNARSLLSVALDEALDRELCKSNVAADVKLPRGLATTQKLDLEGILLPEEQEALLAAVPVHQRPAVLFALAMGVRWSELSWLRWEDLRPDAVVIRRSRGGLAAKSGKPRRLALSPPAKIAIEGARGLRKDKCPWVFPGPRKQGPRVQAPSQWDNWVEAAKITKHVNFHDLRHTTATSLLAGWWGGEKWSLEEVRKLLGHSTIKVTERYARLLDDMLDQAVLRTTFATFPGGKENGASIEVHSDSNAFVNRRSRVQVSKLAPNDPATLQIGPENPWEDLGKVTAEQREALETLAQVERSEAELDEHLIDLPGLAKPAPEPPAKRGGGRG